jgi:uncharacterized protein (TIGR03067 family)
MFAFFCTIALVYAPAAEEAKPPKELKEIQGRWRLIDGEEVGRKFGAEEAKKEPLVFHFQGDSLIVRKKLKVIEEATIVVHPGGHKGAIDFKHQSGKYKDKTCHAIYSLDGGKLTICTASKMRADKPEDRPTVFSTDKKQEKPSHRPGTLLFILEREKEKK